MISDALSYLQTWYASQCDGDWEHGYGVTIDTLDNPGWRLEIDLVGTSLEGVSKDRMEVDRSDDGWVHVWSDGAQFHGACGPLNLGEMLDAFHAFAGTSSTPPPA
ncbi:immunity 53 family protein [Nonomuraea gerenzanensis]|uniref:immunity 53 family protein n=1 Tax=Nonomuraea gerenzanensis TaxID=93944 RepID=UPI001CD9DF5B|nr:immunity 53 family protein [Nonomuraea gerenzanensis]UBU13523.1 immunity 53 family protein [Nonomuraea gerenzanensis]